MKNLKYVVSTSLACVFSLIMAVSTASAGTPVSAVPEIDGNIAGSALAVLIGGYLVVAAKWRRK